MPCCIWSLNTGLTVGMFKNNSMVFHVHFRSASQDQIQPSRSTDNLSNTSSTDGSGPDRKFTLPLKSIRPDLEKFIFAPDVEEVRVSPVVARKGWLNFLDEKSNGWVKKWVVCTIIMYSKNYHLVQQNIKI